MRGMKWVLTGLVVAACSPDVARGPVGVGFGDYTEYALRREAELRGAVPAQSTPAAQSIAPPGSTAPTAEQPMNGAPLSALTPGTLAEGNIGADAMAALRATSPNGARPISPDAMQVNGAAGPNLAAYALSVTHQPGQPVYPRNGISLTSSEKACAKYVSPDLAQMAFLESGGPEKDRRNLDPDGDGFACGWDPRPFRTALQ